MTIWPGILALCMLAIGWHYVFSTRAADRLTGIESPAANCIRRRNRRAAGLLMLPMAVLFFAGSYFVNATDRPGAFVIIWMIVMLLLLAVLVLAVIDMRLTAKLRKHKD